MYLHRFNDFGADGGPAAKELDPKVAVVEKYLISKLGDGAVKIEVRLLFLSFSCILLWTFLLTLRFFYSG